MNTNKYETYLCRYIYGNDFWGFSIQATSFEDAEARLKAIYANGKVDGVLGETIAVEKKEEQSILKTLLNRLFKL